jgi:hypothetical protein
MGAQRQILLGPGATLFWLCRGKRPPGSVFCGAPELELSVKHPFGRAPLGAARGARAGALPRGP